MNDFQKRLGRGRDLIKKASKVVAFSGAGISTESGLTDFRSPGGIWDRYRMVTYQEFCSSHEARIAYWQMRRELIPELLKARPNKAHFALAELEKRGRLEAVITQNIDGLHQEAGSRDVIELHGTNRTASCLRCRRAWPIVEIQRRLEQGDLDPGCDACGGRIKPDTVSFGQAMPESALNRAFDLAGRCDLMLMIGSSLEVQPAASVPLIAQQNGARLIFINRTPTPYDSLATVCFREPAGEVLEGLTTSG